MKQSKKPKVIGILGGMGPDATVDLYSEIIRQTPIKQEQDHLPVIIFSNPKVPDRTKALVAGGEDPLPHLIYSAQVLEKAGADFIIIPCNTAHHYLPQLQKEVSIPILNMIGETADFITQHYPREKQVGLLATTGTIKVGIYSTTFRERGLRIIHPEESTQQSLVMRAIYDIKAKKPIAPAKRRLKQAACELISKGCSLIVMGCTEVPLGLNQKDMAGKSVQLIDPKVIISRAAINLALGKSPPPPK